MSRSPDTLSTSPTSRRPYRARSSVHRHTYSPLDIVPLIFLGCKLFSKFATTRHGANSFVTHKQISGFLATNIIWGAPVLSMVQNAFASGGSGFKAIQKLLKHPRRTFNAACHTVANNKAASAFVLFRLFGEAVSSYSASQAVLHEWIDGAGDEIPTSGWTLGLALFFTGINFISSMAFSAKAEIRFYQKISGSHQPTRLTAPEHQTALQQAHRLLLRIPEYRSACDDAALDTEAGEANIAAKYQAAMAHPHVRAIIISELRKESDTGKLTLQKAIEKQSEAHIIRQGIEHSAYHFEGCNTFTARVAELLIQAPFLYFIFRGNQKHCPELFDTAALVPAIWAGVQTLLYFFKTQALDVDAIRTGLTQTSSPKQIIHNHFPHNIHGIFVSLLCILPFGVFGAGQLLDLAHSLSHDEETQNITGFALVGSFLVTHLLTYYLFMGERIVRKMPGQHCGQREKDWIDYNEQGQPFLEEATDPSLPVGSKAAPPTRPITVLRSAGSSPGRTGQLTKVPDSPARRSGPEDSDSDISPAGAMIAGSL